MAKRPKVFSVEVIDGVKVTMISPNNPQQKPVTAQISNRARGNFVLGTYRAVKMY